MEEAQAMRRGHSLAASSAEVRTDLKEYFEAVGSAGDAVRQTIRKQ